MQGDLASAPNLTAILGRTQLRHCQHQVGMGRQTEKKCGRSVGRGLPGSGSAQPLCWGFRKASQKRDNQARPLGWIRKAGSARWTAGSWPKPAPLEELKMGSDSKLEKGQGGQFPEISQPTGASSLCPSMPRTQKPPALSFLLALTVFIPNLEDGQGPHEETCSPTEGSQSETRLNSTLAWHSWLRALH